MLCVVFVGIIINIIIVWLTWQCSSLFWSLESMESSHNYRLFRKVKKMYTLHIGYESTRNHSRLLRDMRRFFFCFSKLKWIFLSACFERIFFARATCTDTQTETEYTNVIISCMWCEIAEREKQQNYSWDYECVQPNIGHSKVRFLCGFEFGIDCLFYLRALFAFG